MPLIVRPLCRKTFNKYVIEEFRQLSSRMITGITRSCVQDMSVIIISHTAIMFRTHTFLVHIIITR